MSTTSKLSFTSSDDDGFTTELSSVSTATPRIEAGADKPYPVATRQKRRAEYHFVVGLIFQFIVVITLLCLAFFVLESEKLQRSAYIDLFALVVLWAFFLLGCFVNHICMDIMGVIVFILYCLLSFGMTAVYGIFGLGDHCEDPEEHFKEVCDRVRSDNNDALYLTVFWGVCFVAYGLFAFLCIVSACTNRKPKGRSVVVQPKQLPQQPSRRSGKHKRSHQHLRRSSSNASSKSVKTVTSQATSKSAAPSLSSRSIASVNNPETSSMQSYVPPMNQGPSQYTPSSYRSTCPYAASECSTTACPYYRGPRQAGTQALQPYHPHGAAAPVIDPKRSIVIDLPEAHHLPQGGNNNGGYIDIQRIVVNLPQAYGQGNQRHHNAQQRPIVSVPQTPGQESSVSMGTGQPRNHKENVYVTSVTPITKR